MVISILGCGWYGKALAIELIKNGVTVKGSTTSSEKIETLSAEGIKPYLINLSPENRTINDDFFICDILWVCIPPRARAGKGMEYISQLTQLLGLINKHDIKQVVLISSTGVYGDDNSTLTELNDPQPDTDAGKILLGAEGLLRSRTSFTTTVIRFGGLIGPGRDPGRFFAGKTGIANGDAPVNLIHLTDCLGISCAIIEKQAFGIIYNAVTPQHPSRSEFYTKAAKCSGLDTPHFIAEKKRWKIVESVNVPALLQYSYQVDVNE